MSWGGSARVMWFVCTEVGRVSSNAAQHRPWGLVLAGYFPAVNAVSPCHPAVERVAVHPWRKRCLLSGPGINQEHSSGWGVCLFTRLGEVRDCHNGRRSLQGATQHDLHAASPVTVQWQGSCQSKLSCVPASQPPGTELSPAWSDQGSRSGPYCAPPLPSPARMVLRIRARRINGLGPNSLIKRVLSKGTEPPDQVH